MGAVGDCLQTAKELRRRLREVLPLSWSKHVSLPAGVERINQTHETGRSWSEHQVSVLQTSKEVLSHYSRVSEVEVDAFCETRCRRSYHFYCRQPDHHGTRRTLRSESLNSTQDVKSQTFEASLRSAITRNARTLGLPHGYGASGAVIESPLSVLSFVYGTGVSSEWTQILLNWAPPSIGFGADVILIGREAK